MRKVQAVLSTMLVLVLILIGSSTPAGADDTDLRRATGDAPAPVCGWYFTEGCGVGWHKLQGPSGSGFTGLHGDCRYCLGGGTYGCHGSCTPEDEDEDIQLAYKLAVAAVEAGDAPALYALAEVIPTYVSVNHERGSVQLLDCQKELVIGNLPVVLAT